MRSFVGALLSLPASLAAQPSPQSGVVYDSLAREPLAGAEVRLTTPAGTTFSAVTDTAGRFQIADLPPGRYAAEFRHTAVDTLGFERSPVAIEVSRRNQVIRLGSPSAQTIFRAACAGGRTEGPQTVIIGEVRSAADGVPLLGASALVTRATASIQGDAVRRGELTTATEVGDDGAFVFCGAPENLNLFIRAASGADTSGAIPLRLSANSVRHVTLTIGRARREVVRRPPSPDEPAGMNVMAWRGQARVRGTITNPAGAPMAGARVQVLGAEREVVTGQLGTFTLDSLPEGTQILEVRAIGFEPMRPVVQLSSRTTRVADVRLLYRAVTLSEVVVRGSYEQNMEGFEQRRRTSASGYFLGPDEIARRPKAQSMATLIDGTPLVQVNCLSAASCRVVMFSGRVDPTGPVSNIDGSRLRCVPSIYVDGLLQRHQDFTYLAADQIAAVEIYPRNFRPAEFTDLLNDCGSIAYWTRLRGPRSP